MDVDEMLERMRDPLGAPFYPQVLRVLLVVTWVLHIFFVTLALGSSTYTIYGFARKGEHRLRLAGTTARLTPNAVGLGIVTGIAPLLFVQTIYDPIWYASNSLTGFWSVIFVFVVMGGYGAGYLFSLKGSKDGRLLWSAVASTVLISFAGWIMHVLASVQLRPDEWRRWYAPDGIVDTKGLAFHDFSLPRLALLLPIQAAVSIACVLVVYAWFAARRDGDRDGEYQRWVADQGRRLGLATSPLYALAGVGWALTQGRRYDLALPVAVALVLVAAGLGTVFARATLERARSLILAWGVAITIVAVIRELVRSEALARFGYRVSSYPYQVSWGSVLLFTVTSVVGVSILVYLALVLYQSGMHEGKVSLKVDRFGRVATAMLGGWFGFFLLLGLYTVVVLK